jgi:aminoglycoside 3-N-acetyltransferase
MQSDVQDGASVAGLSADWHTCGVERGDMLLLHSNISQTLRKLRKAGLPASPDVILGSFLSALGGEGTLLLPLFNFGFAHGKPFDMRSTLSEMGALTEAGRLYPGSVRTGHPIYSFAVIGAQAGRFSGITNFSGYGADSPFALLRQLGGKIGVLNLPDQHSMTFYHHVEEMCEVPYRYHKRFGGLYTDMAGNTAEREFGLFVRRLEDGVKTDVDAMAEQLWNLGLYHGCRPGEGCGLRTILADELFNATADVIRSGRAEGMLYRIEKP